MSTIPAIQSSLSGINNGLQRLNESAAKIANTDVIKPEADITTPLVDSISAKQQIEASAKVLETQNVIIGSILAIKV